MRVLFQSLRSYLDHFFEKVDLEQVERIASRVCSCQGTLILSGVGKSGYIAQKITATLVSTGTRAIFLAPVDALHGDIGILSAGDLFLAFSKSGESEELLALIPYLQKRQVFTIGIVSHPNSRLSAACDFSICLPVQRELCPYDLVPTTSTIVQLIFGDCLAIALMQSKNFALSDFVSNHPAGFLGRKMTMTVADLMLKGDQIPICRGEEKLLDLLHEFTAKRCGCLLIVDVDLKLQGIFTDGDLRRTIQTQGMDALQLPIEKLMTSSLRKTEPKQPAIAALRQMEEDPKCLITVLPVVDCGRVVGLLRMHDILQSGLH